MSLTLWDIMGVALKLVPVDVLGRVDALLNGEADLLVGGLSRDTLWDGVLYKEEKVSIYGELQPMAGLELGVWARYGDQVDFANSRLGDQLRVQPFIDWNVNRNLLMKLRATLLDLDTEIEVFNTLTGELFTKNNPASTNFQTESNTSFFTGCP